VIDDHGGELGLAGVFLFTKGVLIDADDFRPGVVEFFNALALKHFVIGLVDEPIGAAMSATNAFEIDEVFASPVERCDEALGVAFAFLNAWDGLGEGFLAGFTPESSFADEQNNTMAPDWGVTNTNDAMIVGALRGGGTTGAELSHGFFLTEPTGVVTAFGDDLRENELG